MTSPGGGGLSAAEQANATMEAVVENKEQLGLTWGLRPATVSSASPLEAILDGDSAAIGVISMTGALSVGERVYVMYVPPSGNYVMGRCLPQPLLRARLTNAALAQGVPTNISYDTVDEEAGDWGINAATFATITIPESGIYQMTAVLGLGSNAVAGSRQEINLGFTTTIANWSINFRGSWSNGGSAGAASALIRLNKGDSFLTRVFQDSVASTNYSVWLTAARKSG